MKAGEAKSGFAISIKMPVVQQVLSTDEVNILSWAGFCSAMNFLYAPR
jgi:hypothetical protein